MTDPVTSLLDQARKATAARAAQQDSAQATAAAIARQREAAASSLPANTPGQPATTSGQ